MDQQIFESENIRRVNVMNAVPADLLEVLKLSICESQFGVSDGVIQQASRHHLEKESTGL